MHGETKILRRLYPTEYRLQWGICDLDIRLDVLGQIRLCIGMEDDQDIADNDFGNRL